MCSPDDPPTKRHKAEMKAGMFITGENKEIALPSEIWGHVLDYLPFSDVMRCAAVSRHMLHGVLPFVSQLSIYKKEELRCSYAKRFAKGNVAQIDVYCLITCLDPDENEEKFSICQSTASRIVPFVCHFQKLQTIGLDVDASGVPLGTYFRDTFVQPEAVEIVRSLVRSICGAYQTGAFTQLVRIYGPAFQAGTFICYKAEGCCLCKMYCESFPLEQAVNARATCISVRERLDAIASRPGGSECLASNSLVLELLASNYQVPFEIITESSPSESISESAIVFSKAVMEELEYLCTNYFDTKTLTPQMVLEALAGTDDLEDDEEIWLVKKYHEWLTGLGIPVSDSDVSIVDESKLLSDVHIHM